MDVNKVIDARYDLEHEISKLVCEFNALTDCHVASVKVDNYESGSIVCEGEKSETYEKYIVKMDIDSGI